MKSVNIKGLDIKPLETVRSCEVCKEPARWTLNLRTSKDLCSSCFLYDYLSDQREEIEGLILALEDTIGEVLARKASGLLTTEGTDRVAMGIVTAQRFEKARKF